MAIKLYYIDKYSREKESVFEVTRAYLIEFSHAHETVLELVQCPERADPQLRVGHFDEGLNRPIVLADDVLASEHLSMQPHHLIRVTK